MNQASKIVMSVIMSFCFIGIVNADVTYNDLEKSVCKVIVLPDKYTKDIGSGMIIYEDNDKYYILTNAHVTEGNKWCYLRFFQNGYESVDILGMVESRKLSKNGVDVSIVSCSKKYFKS